MPVFYLDTSALVKRYRREHGSAIVADLVDNALADDRFYFSFLSVLECTAAILRPTKTSPRLEEIAVRAIAAFLQDLNTLFRPWPLDDDITEFAVAVVEDYKLRSADSIHLATALTLSRLEPDHTL